MRIERSILGYPLIAVYLLVILHQSTTHSHATAEGSQAVAHQEKDRQTAHHHHHFHDGLFHFLGHLFDNISHSENAAEEHLTSVQKTGSKKIAGSNRLLPAATAAFLSKPFVVQVDAASLPDPPACLSTPTIRFLVLSCPFRGPPVDV